MSSVDPFELRESLPRNKREKALTFAEFNDIISKHMEEVENWPPSMWGFTREDFLDSLEELREKAREKCHC
tara:strand:+ start:1911 stop:2123 length:213 start_codon:yes stop_codon:yes gene_type:complete